VSIYREKMCVYLSGGGIWCLTSWVRLVIVGREWWFLRGFLSGVGECR
jgi:hypothetical protein